MLLIDRHPLVGDALRRLLTGPPLNAEVLATTLSTDAVEICERTPIDVVVCDVKARPVSGPLLATMLATRNPEVKVILLADHESEPLLLASLLSGAAGFFMKESSVEEFVAGVGTVLHGQCVVGSALLGPALARLANQRGRNDQEPIRQLSPAECHILALVAQAQSIRSIAEMRGVSPKTIRNHLARIYHKLPVRNRAEAILWAVRMGLTPGPVRDQPGRSVPAGAAVRAQPGPEAPRGRDRWASAISPGP